MPEHRRPSFGVTLFAVLLPVVLMMGKALVDILIEDESQWFRQIFDILGTPVIALLLAVIVGMVTLGRGAGMTRDEITKAVESGLPPVAGIILIVAAGGGFKQVLVDTGIGTLLAEWAEQVNISVIVLAWVLAVLIRLATGSATVATITASSLILGLVEGMEHGSGVAGRAGRRAPDRCSSPTSTTPGSGWSISTSGSASARPSRPGRSWRRSCRWLAWSWCCCSTSSSDVPATAKAPDKLGPLSLGTCASP